MTDATLLYRPADGWLGDVMPFYENGAFHLFFTFLHGADLGGENVLKGLDWAHVVTSDFVAFDSCPLAIRRGTSDEADLIVGAGSVIRAGDGKYHAYYGAINPARSAHGHAEQIVMRATSDDLIAWTKDATFAIEGDPTWYERHDWRDPFVYRDASGWRMLLCARITEGPFDRRGAFGMATSTDLNHWTVVEPALSPGITRAPECPEIFELGGRWYLLYSTYSDRFATRYRIGTSPSGPWHRPAWDAIDANDAYAMKTVSNGERRYAIGWLATRSRDRDAGHRQWGGDLVVHELHPRSDGSLGASPVAGLLERFVTRPVVPDPRQGAWSTALGAASFDGGPFGWASLGEVGETALVDVTIDARDRPEEFGIALRAAPDFGSSYLVRIEFDRGRVVFDRRPHTVDVPFDQNSDRSYVSASDHEIERPLIAPDGAVRVRVIVDGSAILAYINDVALTTRGYDLMGGEFAVYAANGPLRVKSAQVGRLVDTGRADAG